MKFFYYFPFKKDKNIVLFIFVVLYNFTKKFLSINEIKYYKNSIIKNNI